MRLLKLTEVQKLTKHKLIKKTISWEVSFNFVCLFIVWMIFGDIEICVALAAGLFILKSIMYYIHERIWEKIK